MKNGYKIKWTVHALNELKETFDYLDANWTEREMNKLGIEIEKTLKLISINPELFPTIRNMKNVRRALVTKQNTLYYRTNNKIIEVLSFFSNRKNPDKLKL